MPFTFNPFTGKFDITLKKVINLLSPNNNDVPTTLAVQNGLNTLQSKITTNSINIDFASNRVGEFADKKVVAFGSRCAIYSGQISNGTDTTETSQFVAKNIGNASSIQIYYMNVDPINATTPTTTTNDFNIEASIEYPIGTFTRITFNGGSNTYLLKRGFDVLSDNIKVYIPPDTYYRIRTNVLVNPGEKWQKTRATNGANTGPGEGVIVGTNSVMSGTITNSQTYTYGPTSIIGISETNKGSVLAEGDSIFTGQGDTGVASWGSGETGGYFGRVFGDQFPVMRCNIPAQRLTSWKRSSSRNAILYDKLLSSCLFWVSNLGINDLRNGDSQATIQANMIELWYSKKVRGLRGYHCTITPNTTSTDGWTTTANQTVMAFESIRVIINDWIRDGAPLDYTTKTAVATGTVGPNIVRFGDLRHPVCGYFECADLAETSRNSGIWPANYTADGLHPKNTGYAAITPAFDTNKFLIYN